MGLTYYLWFMALLLACSIGFPIPEEAVLVWAGWLAFGREVSLPGAICVCSASILAGDALVYGLGRAFGMRIAERWPFRVFLTRRRIRRARVAMSRHGVKLLLPIRLVPVARAAAHFTAGMLRYRFWWFLLWDAIGVAVVTPTCVGLAWWFGPEIESARLWIRDGNVALAVLAAGAIGVWLLWRWRRARATPALEDHMTTQELLLPPRPGAAPPAPH